MWIQYNEPGARMQGDFFVCLALSGDRKCASAEIRFRYLIQAAGAAILNADAQILGGITEFRQVAALSAVQEIHIHLVCAISNGLLLEFYGETVDPLRIQIFQEPMLLDAEGNVPMPKRPGLGFTANYELLERYRVG